MRRNGFTLFELLVVIAILGLLATLVLGSVRAAFHSASLAVSSNNIRSLMVGSVAYLGDHDSRFWRFRENKLGEGGVYWWFGYEPQESLRAGEGERWFDPDKGPLGGYVSAGLVPDPSFSRTGKAFKPKYRFGYIGLGYNVLLADSAGHAGRGWAGSGTPARLQQLPNPEEVVVFATSAQVNTFQSPATPSNPMIEEFYGIDDREVTVHFRHNGQAMVVFANGSTGLLDMDPSTLDTRAPDAMIGRFAGVGSTRYLR